MSSIMVIGGAGFIGSNLIERLLDNEHNQVICVDDFSTGKLSNISRWDNHPRFTYREFDIIADDIAELSQYKVQSIYLLACPASPKAYQSDPFNTIYACVDGTRNAIKLAGRNKAKLLLTSTSEIYGEPQVHPQPETYRGNVNTLGIRACYDEGKRIAETLIMEANRCFNIDTRIARIFNTYGRGMDKNDGRVVSNFLHQAINNEDITIYGSGEQTRCFCYIDDTVNGLIALMDKEESDDIHLPVNIGNNNEVNMVELARLILDTCRVSKSKIVYEDSLPEDDPTRRCPDLTRAKHVLDWSPSISLSSGLRKYLAYELLK